MAYLENSLTPVFVEDILLSVFGSVKSWLQDGGSLSSVFDEVRSLKPWLQDGDSRIPYMSIENNSVHILPAGFENIFPQIPIW